MSQIGGRWLNERPTPEEFAEWFGSVRLHDGMEHSRYIGGVTLVSAREKIDVAEQGRNGQVVISKRDQLVYVPYPKVETRVAYFWDLMLLNTDRWVGEISAVPVRKQPKGSAYDSSEGLPPGFFYSAAKTSKGVTVFVNCSMQAVVWERESYARKVAGTDPVPILRGTGTKQVPLLRYEDRADENGLMKAETGAVGRALGMIGMLTLPGSGVSSADDMAEAKAQEGRSVAAVPETSEPPTSNPARQVEKEEDEMRARATVLASQLKSDHPEAFEMTQEWAKERNFTRIADLSGPALKGFVRKLEKTLADAEAS